MTTEVTPPAQPPTTDTKEVASARTSIFSLADMRQEMDRLWETVMGGRWPRLATVSPIREVPAVDVFQKDGHVHVRAELPGLAEDDIDVEVDADGVVISGEKREEHEVKEEDYYRSERTYGKFTRRVALPANADVDKATATFKNGVLQIDMPLKQETAKKKIELTP